MRYHFTILTTGIKWYNSSGDGALCVSESPHAKGGLFLFQIKQPPS